jgi:hypothetical protein
LFISQERPAFFVNKEYYNVKTSSEYIFSAEELKQISAFYCRNYRIGKSNNTIQVDLNDLNRYINVLSELLIIKNENNLLGSIISFNIPIKINSEINIKVLIKSSDRFNFFKSENSLMFGCSSFLILDEKYRGKGFGMALIQESLQKLYEYGGLGAYFINTVSRCDNSIPLFSWFYPLNLEKLDTCKFNYPKDYKSYFILKDEGRRIEKVEDKNVKNAYDFYMNYVKDKKFYFAPSYEYWQKWIQSFPTFLIYKDNEISGLFSFNSNNVRYALLRSEIMNGILLTCIGEQPETLQSSLFTAKKFFDILTIHETGDLTKKVLLNVFAQNSHKCYINFFNTRLKIDASDFYCPLF